MNYIDLIGDWQQAENKVKNEGGRLYRGNNKDSCSTVVIGNNCFTYWSPKSKKRQLVKQLCDYFNISSEGQTGGRLARWFLKEIIELPYKGTYWDRNYRAIAKQGQHWHYTYVNAEKYFIGVEFDLKSAYFNSLFAGESLLYQNNLKFRNDNGALERLKVITPDLPKWFRLQLLGILSSWKMDYWTREPNALEDTPLIRKTLFKIEYGAAFNAAHRAIIRNYKIMQKVHQIGGEYIERMHTDSFFLNLKCPENIENAIFDYLEEKGAQIDIKTAGQGYFFDLNTGYIGKDFIGNRLEVIDRMRERNIKKERDGGYQLAISKYERRRIIREKIEEIARGEARKNIPPYEQMELYLPEVNLQQNITNLKEMLH